MRGIFGWSLPPGCTQQHIDDAFGCNEPLDCPICSDGMELEGPDCMAVTEDCTACTGTGKVDLNQWPSYMQNDPRYEGGKCPSCSGAGKWSMHGPTCPKHGCIVCGDLEKQRPIPPDPMEGLAAELESTDQMIFADLDQHPENVQYYNPALVAKWRESRNK